MKIKKITARLVKITLSLIIAVGIGALFIHWYHPLPTTKEEVNIYVNKIEAIEAFISGFYYAEHNFEIPQEPLQAVIVPHHLLASKSMAAGIYLLKQPDLKHIILLSPDHFNQCQDFICTTTGIFQTKFGPLMTSKLTELPLVSYQKDLFETEHGIFSLLPFIAYYHPQVKITPLVISLDTRWLSKKEALYETLSKLKTANSVIVLSTDFSHYLPLAEANEQDETTLKVILDQDLPKILNLENPAQSDCPICLWGLTKLALEHKFPAPKTLRHTNSAEITNEPQIKETTSHFLLSF